MPDSYSRRHFLKLSAALLAGGAAIAAAPDARGMGFSGVPDVGPVTEMKGYCPFCQVRCTYRARVSGGKVLSLTGEKGNYWTGGAMCPKGVSIVELIGSPYRITEPMRRKENGEWERVTYAQAVDMVAERMAEVIKKHGKAAANRVGMTMPLWDCRESEIAALMTLRIAGSVHAMPPGESCVSSASNMLGMMIGVNSGSTKVGGQRLRSLSPVQPLAGNGPRKGREDRLSRSAPDPDEPACRHAAAPPAGHGRRSGHRRDPVHAGDGRV